MTHPRSSFSKSLSFRYGIVYKGKWAGETVAVKRYREFLPSNDTEAQNFFNFRSDYIVGFRGICCSLNSLIMEYCPYGSVQSWFGKGKLTEELKILICYDCARGVQVYILFHAHCCTNLLLSFETHFYFVLVQFLHSSKVTHRDLKPDNLLLASFSTNKEDVRAKLSDFVLSKNSLKTLMSSQVGTPVFTAPEV